MPNDRIQDERRPEVEERLDAHFDELHRKIISHVDSTLAYVEKVEFLRKAEEERRRHAADADNPQALIACCMGVLSLIPLIGILLGIASIVLGILGLKYRKTHPTAGGTAHAWLGIFLGTLSLLGHLAAIDFFVAIVKALQ